MASIGWIRFQFLFIFVRMYVYILLNLSVFFSYKLNFFSFQVPTWYLWRKNSFWLWKLLYCVNGDSMILDLCFQYFFPTSEESHEFFFDEISFRTKMPIISNLIDYDLKTIWVTAILIAVSDFSYQDAYL